MARCEVRNGIGRSRERILREEREALVWIGKMVRRRRRRWKEKNRRGMPSANIGAFERERERLVGVRSD